MIGFVQGSTSVGMVGVLEVMPFFYIIKFVLSVYQSLA